ncbi:Phosphatidyl-N-methylethanolamine N-methyltransferase [Mycoblastus sanguinarius]|nr:Phosphatidyl-N-methylethanolamine N-methyltransferase [Mycoblastus sanguinarius]
MSEIAGGLIDFSQPSLYSELLNPADLQPSYTDHHSLRARHSIQPYILEHCRSPGYLPAPADHLPLDTHSFSPQLPEYHNKTLTRLFGGNSRRACYAIAVTIFSLGLIRDALYERALRQQPLSSTLYQPYLAYALLAIGNTLVLTSYYALGVTGTFLGDYFGILMDEKVEGFPFSVTSAPMYWGSTCSFLGTAVLYGRPAGVLLTGFVFSVYWGALQFEDPFTSEIYAKRDRESKEGKKAK